tara:strand:+ start:281 stop:838 length:558 start_codon:yes stop_codon:yes gene_type:complete
MGTIKATNIEPIADNGTVTLGSSGDTFALASGAKQQLLRPAFYAYLSADQTGIADNVVTKVQLNATTIDTDSGFDTTTNYRYTIPSEKGGKYFISAQAMMVNASVSTMSFAQSHLYKNGTRIGRGTVDFRNNYGIRCSPNVNAILDLSAGDYLELHVQVDRTSGSTSVVTYDNGETYLTGFRIGD